MKTDFTGSLLAVVMAQEMERAKGGPDDQNQCSTKKPVTMYPLHKALK